MDANGGFMRVLKWLAGGFVCLCAGVVLLIVYGMSSGTQVLHDFFGKVAAGPTPAALGEIHPALAEVADARQIVALVREIQASRGAFQGVETNGFSFSDDLSGGVRKQEYAGTLQFEKGNLSMALGFVDGKLVKIEIRDQAQAEELMKAISRIPSETDSYRDRGLEFLQKMFGGQPEAAFALMSPHLQKQLGQQLFQQQLASFAPFGKLAKVSFVKVAPAEQPDLLTLEYLVEFEGRQMPGTVGFQFVGFQSHLIAFQVSPGG
jgi:hypothetical protein